MLIQHKVYGFGEPQFENNLTQKQVEHLHSENFGYEQALKIAESKNYKGGLEMRGRQSFNPLEKMGLAFIDENSKIQISIFGAYFLEENYDLGEVFFRSFIKWQYPNPDANKYKSNDYNIKPFIATLHLLKKVNQLCEELHIKVKGVSKTEFALFFVSLSNYQNIGETAKKLIDFRITYENSKNSEEQTILIQNYFDTHFSQYESWNNALEYTDNIIRYFRLTRYLYLRGGDFYIDLEPRRKIEIDALLNFDSAQAKTFATKKEYVAYIGALHEPQLPWETKETLIAIIQELEKEIVVLQSAFLHSEIRLPAMSAINTDSTDIAYLKKALQQLRDFRRALSELQIRLETKHLDAIKNCINNLQNIFSVTTKRPVELERLVSVGLHALNDALEIKPNFPVGDDNEPTFTAPANKPDIECFYNSFNTVCEVTLLTNRSQWYNEGQPVMRHVRDFEVKNAEKDTYCLFIAPKLHTDTLNTFWIAVKYEYEGKKQKIIPLSIQQFIEILNILILLKQKNLPFTHTHIQALFESVIQSSQNAQNSVEWLKAISENIARWGKSLGK